MLFSYAPEAHAENWLHDAIVVFILSGMEEIDSGKPLTAWPVCIMPAHAGILAPRYGLRDRRADFFKAYQLLSLPQRATVKSAVTIQNAFPQLFDGVSPWMRMQDLPSQIHAPAKALFEFAFGFLTPLGLRDQHYKVIYRKLPARICPFCGVERLEAPGQPREDLDHYFPLPIYPFAGANLRNLSPMGGRCNSSFKHAADVIFDEVTNSRRRCADPYNGPIFSVSLKESVPFQGDQSGPFKCPEWVVDFEGGDPDIASTWDAVFKIRQRYIASVLNPEFGAWMRHFAVWRSDPRSAVTLTDTPSVVHALTKYVDTVLQEGLADSNFLKRAVFCMLRDKCTAGGDPGRVVDWLISLGSME